MGQKVNPHGMRVGVIKDWDSRWFTSKQEFGDTLVEDHKIRKTLKKQLYAAGVPKIEIERTVDSQTGTPRVKVNVFCAKPGIVIGKGGAESAKIEKQLAKLEDVVDIKKLEPGSSVTRELILVKIRAKDTERQPILNVTEIFHGKIVDVTNDSMVIELTGHQDKLEAFLDLLQGYDILELARTGITGLSRGTADVKIME